ncbi:MAG TPA: hypothetical protein VFX92_09905, partial [Candidatus Krumholzibacteria bacterium]|nr:hypothetical protein [Candidatus Krumholzibacteria bacterium]
MNIRALAVLFGAALVAQLGAAGAPAATPDDVDTTLVPPPGNYRDAPVYYEHFLDRYSDPSDLEFLRGGRVRVRHYDPVDVSAFDWTSTSSTDYTWFMQMQEMR